MNKRSEEHGSVLAMALVLVVVLMIMAVSSLEFSTYTFKDAKHAREKQQASQRGEGAIAQALEMLNLYLLDPNLAPEDMEPDYFRSGSAAAGGQRYVFKVPRNCEEYSTNPNYTPDWSEYWLIEIMDDGADNIGAMGEAKIIRATGVRDEKPGTNSPVFQVFASMEVTVQTTTEISGVYSNAVYSGNTSGDENFNLTFSGDGTAADYVTGSIYSGGNIEFKGDALANFNETQLPGWMTQDEDREARSTGDIIIDEVNEPDPDTSRLEDHSGAQDSITRADIMAVITNYPDYVINVPAQFAANEKPAKTAQISAQTFSTSTKRTNHWSTHRDFVIDDPNNPAKIFTHGRKNGTGYTGSFDPTIGGAIANQNNPPAHPQSGVYTYHIEDPFVTNNSGSYGASPHVNIPGGPSAPFNQEGNMKMYYFPSPDGVQPVDLWIHNSQAYDFAMKHPEPDGIKIAFVVEGNIRFSDNILANNQIKDMFMFIALRTQNDSNQASNDPAFNGNSGNIYMGDPQFGTVEQLDTMLYAENDFLENNLNAQGSAEVLVNGNMTAGDQLALNRDFGNGIGHSQLNVIYDDRLVSDSQQAQNFREDMPGWMTAIVTNTASASARTFAAVAFREGPQLRVLEENSTILELGEVVAAINTWNEGLQQ